MQNRRVIPATKETKDFTLHNGATITVRRLGRSELVRVIGHTRFDQEDHATHGRFAVGLIRASVVRVRGAGDLDAARPVYHDRFDLDVMPDEIADLVIEDDAVISSIVAYASGGVLQAGDVPNSSRQPAGSTDAPSGLPPTTSSPTE